MHEAVVLLLLPVLVVEIDGVAELRVVTLHQGGVVRQRLALDDHRRERRARQPPHGLDRRCQLKDVAVVAGTVVASDEKNGRSGDREPPTIGGRDPKRWHGWHPRRGLPRSQSNHRQW